MREQPALLLQQSLDKLLHELPNIREGTEEGFHQGRVAIRRIRELLAVIRHQDDNRTLSQQEAALARTAKVLGYARDADVAQEVVDHLESRLPVPPAAARLRAALAAEQLAARRSAIKEIETLDVSELHKSLRIRLPRTSWHSSSAWRSALRAHLRGRAGEVRSAIAHASGVYFPNRVHNARIAVKRFRYALELVQAAGTWRVPHARPLKQVQSALGDAHDREIVIARLNESPGAQTNGADTAGVERFLRAEIQDLHATYLKLRPDVLDV